MQNSYTVINASAGSGKTYALVQRLLMICLRHPNQHSAIRNILALTFTNKAANEMKERILAWLGKFSAEDFAENTDLKNLQDALSAEGIKITLDELHLRAKKMLDYVLHNYSTLHIGTIDKFNARLVRSFSYELGLAKNFNLEIDAEPFLIEAVDKMLDKIGEDEEISQSFLDYVDYSLENNERINLNKNLYQSAKEFVKDIHHDQLKKNQDFDHEKYEEIKNRLRKEIFLAKKESKNLALNAVALFEGNNLEVADFAGGSKGLGGFFLKVLDYYERRRPDFPFPSNEENAVASMRKGTSAKAKHKEVAVFEVMDTLLEHRSQLILMYIALKKKEKILAALLPLKVNKDIQDELKKIEDENDLVLLSKFNVLINENLRNEPSAFIYEKVGSQFQHYFFDEFQDTSVLQWQNFLPLRNHSISTDNTSFTLVGDPKQSIYRFRGGESQLMLNIINKTENSPKKAALLILKENWRSAKNIVDFNNKLYRYHAQFLQNEHQKIFGTDAEQIAKSSVEGRVKINLIENQTSAEFFDDVSLKMQRDIQQCLDHGFSLSDITILCRGNTEIFNYSQKLGALEVQYLGETTNIKTISDKGLTLELSYTLQAVIEFLRWETHPKNKNHLVLMMYYLRKLGKISMPDFTEDMRKILAEESHEKTISCIENTYHLKLKQDHFPKFNLYNYIEFYINEFSVDQRETDFLLNFLEMLFNFTQNAGAGIKEFLKYWDEEASVYTIQASENIDAIQIMTIHKAKGLEFPVVFLPFANKNTDDKFNNWYETEDDEALHSVNIPQFDAQLAQYDEGIEYFNAANAYKNKIDRLCVQYVATTRPVEQLFFYLEKPNKTNNHLEILDFLQQEYTSGTDEFDLFPEPKSGWKKQLFHKNAERKTQPIQTIHTQHAQKTAIKIATPSRTYQQRNEKVRRGIFVHEFLSKINTEKDVPRVLERYILDGEITHEEAEYIRSELKEIMQEHAEFFAPHWEVINEKDIMISDDLNTKVYRPDRILKSDDGYVIVDFKTGAHGHKNERQIARYKEILEYLGMRVLQTKLIYL